MVFPCRVPMNQDPHRTMEVVPLALPLKPHNSGFSHMFLESFDILLFHWSSGKYWKPSESVFRLYKGRSGFPGAFHLIGTDIQSPRWSSLPDVVGTLLCTGTLDWEVQCEAGSPFSSVRDSATKIFFLVCNHFLWVWVSLFCFPTLLLVSIWSLLYILHYKGSIQLVFT